MSSGKRTPRKSPPPATIRAVRLPDDTYEIAHYRLFCRLDTDAQGQPKPLLTILCGAAKSFRTEFDDAVYRQVLAYGREYLARNPRSII